MYIVASWVVFIACTLVCIWQGILFSVYKSYNFWNEIPIKLYVLSFLLKITVFYLFIVSILFTIIDHKYASDFVLLSILFIFIFDLIFLFISPKRSVNVFRRSVDGVRYSVPNQFFWQNAEAYRIHRDGDIFAVFIRSDLLLPNDEKPLFDPLVTVHSKRSKTKWNHGKYCIENSTEMTQLDRDGTYQVFEGKDEYSPKDSKHQLRKYYISFDSEGKLIKCVSVFGNKTTCEMIALNCYVEIYYDCYVPFQDVDFENEKALKIVASWRTKRTLPSEIKYYFYKMLAI